MAAPKFMPVHPDPSAEPSYASPDVVPATWLADRPGDIVGRQPTGARLGYQGPDQGYALALAARVRSDLVLSDAEDPDDVVAGCVGIALRRASLFGRAPVIHDVRIAFTIWGYLDQAPPSDLVDLRLDRFEGAADAHHYAAQRELADMVPEATLRMSPAAVASEYATNWRSLLGV